MNHILTIFGIWNSEVFDIPNHIQLRQNLAVFSYPTRTGFGCRIWSQIWAYFGCLACFFLRMIQITFIFRQFSSQFEVLGNSVIQVNCVIVQLIHWLCCWLLTYLLTWKTLQYQAPTWDEFVIPNSHLNLKKLNPVHY